MSTEKKRKRRKRKLLILIIELVLLLILLAVLFLWSKYQKINRAENIKAEDVVNEDLGQTTQEVLSGFTNIAVFGLDNEKKGVFTSGNSDMIMIVSINNDTKEVRVASVYRDTYLNVGTEDDYYLWKANYAYNHGGPEQAVRMLNQNLDPDIADYVAVDFYAICKVIDLLGGLEINVEEGAMMEEINMGHLPFYITEYSTHISLENYINDSTYAAAYIFHQGIQNQANADALGYWLASDFPLEYGNPNSPLFGGNGLVTKHGIQKPAYYAHDFLNRLGERILYQGEHSIVTHDRNGSLQILVYHYGILKQSFADAPMNQELLQYPYSAFEDAKPLEFRLTFSELPKGTYRFKEFSIDLDHGNVLRIWGQLNYSTNVNEDEVQYMASQSVPSMRIHMEELKGAYTLHTVLNHNEARLILIEPIFKGA